MADTLSQYQSMHKLDLLWIMFFFCSMSDLALKDRVDPKRFTGKRFSRRQAFPSTTHDFTIWIDGLVAGRIMKKVLPGQKAVWFWTLTGPYFPGPKSQDGQEETFEAARDEFKKVFWQWQVWALEQQGMATWYGGSEGKVGHRLPEQMG